MPDSGKGKDMFNLMRNIRDCRISSSTDLLVLVHLALRVNFREKDCSCRPSYSKLAEDTRLGVSTVKASAKRLNKGCYIKVRRRNNTSNYFYVQYDFIAAEAASVRDERELAREREDRANWEADQKKSEKFLAADAEFDRADGEEQEIAAPAKKSVPNFQFDEEEDALPPGFLTGGKV
jgi:hypothetical protein